MTGRSSGRLACATVTSSTSGRDPLAPLTELSGVAEAAAEAGEALGRAHRHRTNLRGWPKTAAEAALRAARASSVLDGGALQFPAEGTEPVLASEFSRTDLVGNSGSYGRRLVVDGGSGNNWIYLIGAIVLILLIPVVMGPYVRRAVRLDMTMPRIFSDDDDED